MAQLSEIMQLRTTAGEPVTAGDVTITPQAQAFTIRLSNGGFVWNRPIAVLVERNGQTERIPIVDVTRVAQLALFAISVVLSIAVFAPSIRTRRDEND